MTKAVQVSLVTLVMLVALVVILLGRRQAANPVKLGSVTYQLEVAGSLAAKQKGLGDRSGMPANRGMEFPYSVAGEQCFWMLDMHFSLDMIWLDGAHKVVQVVPNVSPATYPKNYCALAQYVVELNAGQAARAGIRAGQTAYGL